MYDKKKDKKHVLAIADACHENVDILNQEKYFELIDKHISPLIASVGDGEGLPSDAVGNWTRIKVLLSKNSDAWFQEDWYDFCDNVFTFALALANAEGWATELAERYDDIYHLS